MLSILRTVFLNFIEILFSKRARLLKTNSTQNTYKPERITTGVEGLDTLTNGGLIKGGVYLFMGPPGSGKTILGNQICFHHVNNENGVVVYVTLLAESHSRMMGNLRGIDYFNDDLVAKSIHYVSGYGALEKEGLKGLLLLIATMVREKKATLLMIDGITTIGDMDESKLAFRKFTHELNTYIANSGCTAFLSSSLEGHHSNPEHTMVDGIIALHNNNFDLKTLRQIEVRKFRGSDHLKGKHYFNLTEHGIKIYPRLESLPHGPIAAPIAKVRVTMGIEGLDNMLYGGIFNSSITTVIGAAGTGKTILALQFVSKGAEDGDKGLFFGMYESPAELLDKADSLNINLREQVKNKSVEIVWASALESKIDELGDMLLTAAMRTKAKRIVVDGLDAFRYSTEYAERLPSFMVALASRLKVLGATVLFVEETSLFSQQKERQIAELSALNENLIYFQHLVVKGKLERSISILKIRNSIYDCTVREMIIDKDGIKVIAPKVKINKSKVVSKKLPVTKPRKR